MLQLLHRSSKRFYLQSLSSFHPALPVPFRENCRVPIQRFTTADTVVAITCMKKSFRQHILAERMALSSEAVSKGSRLAQRTLLESSEFAAARVVALYSPIRNEVETDEIFRTALVLGKKILFPAVSGSSLVFRAVTEQNDLKSGAFGIMEPRESCVAVPPGEADLIVVPGVAFDVHGRRIGYGKGFYDRVLHALEGGGRLIGICYEFQLIEEIVAESHDVIMDTIVTERRLVRCTVISP